MKIISLCHKYCNINQVQMVKNYLLVVTYEVKYQYLCACSVVKNTY